MGYVPGHGTGNRMNALPIVERELRVAARRAGGHRSRVLTALAAVGVLLYLRLHGNRLGPGMPTGWLRSLAWVGLVACLVEGLRRTADCISEERREGTLGLLFLTDLRPHDIVLGKLAAAALTPLYCLLATLPVLANSLLAGGVTMGEVARTALVLVNALGFSLCAGLWVSARSRREMRALAGAFWLVLVAVLLGRAPIPFLPLASPLYAFDRCLEGEYLFAPESFWISLLLVGGLNLVFLAAACWAVRDFAEAAEPRAVRGADSAAGPGSGASAAAAARGRRAELLSRNPALWLALRNQRPGWYFPVVFLLVAAAGGDLLLAPSAGGARQFLLILLAANFILKVRVGMAACHGLAEIRRHNALETLLCTPVTVDEIVAGQLQALARRLVPPLILIELLQWGLWLAADGEGLLSVFRFPLPGPGLAAFGGFALDLLAAAWVGVWYGLASRQEAVARVKVTAYVLLLPGLLFGLILPLKLLASVLWLGWARQKLFTEFRTQAERRFLRTPEGSGWWPAERTERA